MRNDVSLFDVVDGLARLFRPPRPEPCPPTGPAHVACGPLVTWTLGVEDSEASGLANRDTVLLSLRNDTDDMVAVGCGETNDFIVRREICLRTTRPLFLLLERSRV